MCQVPAKGAPLSPPPSPPPCVKLLNTKAEPRSQPQPQPQPQPRPRPEPQPRTYASPSSPPNSKLLNTPVQPLGPKSGLNPHAEPFSPLTNSPFNSLCLLYAPAMTLPFWFHPMIHFYHPTPVSSSYPQGQGNNTNKEEYVILLNGKKQTKKLVGHEQGQIWVPMKADCNKNSGDDIDYRVVFAGGNTTLMIKNIPNRLKRHELLQILDIHCWKENLMAKMYSGPCWSEYDFLYLPMDFRYGANLGYAFVNFTTTVAAMRFARAFHKQGWETQVPGNKKVCEISRAAIQGQDALKNHFEHFKFNCHTDAYLPVMLSPPSDGWNHTNLTIVGKRVDPVCQRKYPLMMSRKALMK